MPEQPRILILDDDPVVADSLGDFLARQGYPVAAASSASQAWEQLDQAEARAEPVGLIVLDMDMPGQNGMDLLRHLRQRYPAIVPIAVTDFAKIESAVEAVRLGAADYLTKPIIHDELRLAVSRAVHQHVLVAENQTLKHQLAERFGLANLVGSDHRMQKVYELIEAVAPSRTTVLISGESGTGKTMVARAIHTQSPRGSGGDEEQGGPFVTFSCGAIPETLLESELFGHVRGAFTGAEHDKPGRLLAADGGTLFIDEINSATPALQLKLLRVLQERAFEPVGSTQTKHVDVRFVLATNQPLHPLVEQGQFREDLYYRINVVNIHMPSLAERPGDVPLLAEHFLEKFCREIGKQRRFSKAAMHALRSYHWPGNVRELENAVERAVVLSQQPTIQPDVLPEPLQHETTTTHAPRHNGQHHHSPDQNHEAIRIPALQDGWTPTPLEQAIQPAERHIIHAALQANDWNRQQTARQLNINRTTLYKKMKMHGLGE